LCLIKTAAKPGNETSTFTIWTFTTTICRVDWFAFCACFFRVVTGLKV